MRGLVEYHFGWRDRHGTPTSTGFGKAMRASLLHDDVLDHDPLRRGRAALWTVEGIPAAILAGDALFFAAVQVLSTLVSPPQPGAPVFSDSEIIDQVIAFIFAGYETTANALSWALHLLAQHPDVQHRLHAEADRVLAGATILISPYLLHHQPDLYPDPERFDPDRWTTTPPPREAYLPFGAGGHKCIGDTFATVETTLILATIAQHWHLQPVAAHRVHPTARATLRPRGLRLRLAARSTTPRATPSPPPSADTTQLA